jgi:hypothetical protein
MSARLTDRLGGDSFELLIGDTIVQFRSGFAIVDDRVADVVRSVAALANRFDVQPVEVKRKKADVADS